MNNGLKILLLSLASFMIISDCYLATSLPLTTSNYFDKNYNGPGILLAGKLFKRVKFLAFIELGILMWMVGEEIRKIMLSSVAQLCLTLCNPMDCSTLLSCPHHLPRVCPGSCSLHLNGIQPSHPLMPDLPSIRDFFQ